MTATRSHNPWPDTCVEEPPAGHVYRSATWLLGRHPRLANLVNRIDGVVYVEDGELSIDLDHLAEVVSAIPTYLAAWEYYARTHREPEDEVAWHRWRQDGPRPDTFARGLSDFLVLSSGEVAALRLLSTLADERVPFRVSDLCSLDAEGQRLLTDWTEAVRAAYAPCRSAWSDVPS